MEDERGFSPLAAYEAVMHFATERGEAALRLALHAAVPQGFQPELLHLLKRNFVPEAADDPAVEADVLFSPLCEEMGRGYFRFDPQVRALLLENLTANYPSKTSSRIGKVADFIISYVDHQERNPASSQDQLSRDYLEVQRWVAFAFADPVAAAKQFAAAIHDAQQRNDVAARIQLGGLAGALNSPLAGFSQLLNYAEGLQALEAGNRERAGDLFETIDEEELNIGETTLRATSQVLADWEQRHPEYSPPSGSSVAEADDPTETKQGTTDKIDLAVRMLEGRLTKIESLNVIHDLSESDDPKAVKALISSLHNSDSEVRLACVDALGRIGSDVAVEGLSVAVRNLDPNTAIPAVEWLRRLGRKVVVLAGNFTVDKDSEQLAHVISDGLRQRGYLAVQPQARLVVDVSHHADFVLLELSNLKDIFFQGVLRDAIPEIVVPVWAIGMNGSVVENVIREVSEFSSRHLSVTRYADFSEIPAILEGIVSTIESRDPAKPPPAPDFEYDVFISYYRSKTSVDSLEGLISELSQRLELIMGRRLRVFVESRASIAGDFPNALERSIKRSAVFVVVASPTYVESSWCQKEFDAIWRARSEFGTEYSRIFKILSRPIQSESEPRLAQLQSYDFTREPLSTSIISSKTRLEFDRLTSDIATTLDQISQGSSAPHSKSSAPATSVPPAKRTKVLVVFHRSDKRVADRILTHLSPLLRSHRISDLVATSDLEFAETDRHAQESDVLVLIVSANLLASDLVVTRKLGNLLRMQQEGSPAVLPIVAKPCMWRETILSKFQVMPSDRRSIAEHRDRERVYFQITEQIDKVVRDLQRKRDAGPAETEKDTKRIRRWLVITGADDDFAKVNPRPARTTVEDLNLLERPQDMPLMGGNLSRYESRRADPAETTTWTLEAFITGYKVNISGSFRLTLQGAMGATMIAQVPDPRLVATNSPWSNSFVSVREKLGERCNFAANYQRVMMRARITGIGLFQQSHGQIGVADNAIEVYPILNFEWLPLGRKVPRPVANVGGRRMGKAMRAHSWRTELKKKVAKKKSAKALNKQKAASSKKSRSAATVKTDAKPKAPATKPTKPTSRKSARLSTKRLTKRSGNIVRSHDDPGESLTHQRLKKKAKLRWQRFTSTGDTGGSSSERRIVKSSGEPASRKQRLSSDRPGASSTARRSAKATPKRRKLMKR